MVNSELRDQFAAAALQGLLAAPWNEVFRFPPHAHIEPALVAANAYALADAMLAERAKTAPTHNLSPEPCDHR